MEYIDKNENLFEGNSNTNDYLCESYDETQHCFIPKINYDSFNNKKYRYGVDGCSGLISLLMKEQKGRCCYCMARIEPNSIAVEHVIPQSFNSLNAQDEFNYYISQSPLLNQNVQLTDDFEKIQFESTEQIRDEIVKYPHVIAYVNLVASCKGFIQPNGHSCFCNNPRGNKRIVPFMLMEETPASIGYNKLGIIISKNNDFNAKETFKILNLNDETLKEIRLLWCKMSKTEKNIDEIINSEHKARINLFKQIFSLEDFTQLEERWKKYVPAQEPSSVYWKLFIKYDWFYTYYRNEY